MLRTIQRKIALPALLQTRNLFHTRTIARTGFITQSLKPFQYRPVKHEFHSLSPLFDQKEEIPEIVTVVDPKHKMLIAFTCKVCDDRSQHIMSKHSYTTGVVLIQCPGCKNRHLIADNLGWFRDGKTTVEDLMKEKGEAIRHVVVDESGVEKMGDIMEWLPEIAEEEKVKKAEAKVKLGEWKAAQDKEEEK